MDLKFNKDGLIPAIVQDIDTKSVLMLGYMNKKSITKTKEIGKVTFFSRSRQKLWTKGETSGNFLILKEIKYDCDKDALLVFAKPKGPTCHLNNYSCFEDTLFKKDNEKPTSLNILYKLEKLIKTRKEERPKNSYTTSLFNEGIEKIAQKLGEESTEVVIASIKESKEDLIYETSDLIYHLLVLLAEKDVELKSIFNELNSRFD